MERVLSASTAISAVSRQNAKITFPQSLVLRTDWSAFLQTHSKICHGGVYVESCADVDEKYESDDTKKERYRSSNELNHRTSGRDS